LGVLRDLPYGILLSTWLGTDAMASSSVWGEGMVRLQAYNSLQFIQVIEAMIWHVESGVR
jgi:hypothetical protein